MGMKMTFVELTYMGWKDKEKKELFLEGEVIKETSKQIVVKCSDDGLEYTIRKANIKDFKKWTITR